MHKRLGVVLAALGLILVTAPYVAAGHTASQRYVASSGDLGSYYVGCFDEGFCPTGDYVNVAGADFEDGEVPAVVEVNDAVFENVPFFVCQEIDGDNICGGGGEPRAEVACGNTLDLTTTDEDWVDNAELWVFVGTISDEGPGACTPGTTGTISVTYS